MVSLKDIINRPVGKFILENKKRITMTRENFLHYDPLTIFDIKDYFQVNNFLFEEIAVHHVVAITDRSSFMQTGILNLKDLALKSNSFTDFLKDFNITFNIDQFSVPYFEYKGSKIKTDYLVNRALNDRCINGFFLGTSCIEDRNVSNIQECPEIISHIGRTIKSKELEDAWKKISIPSLVSFRANINDIDSSTYNGKISYQEIQEWYILKAFEYLLFAASSFNYPLNHTMIFLKENINIPKENILKIEPLKRGI